MRQYLDEVKFELKQWSFYDWLKVILWVIIMPAVLGLLCKGFVVNM